MVSPPMKPALPLFQGQCLPSELGALHFGLVPASLSLLRKPTRLDQLAFDDSCSVGTAEAMLPMGPCTQRRGALRDVRRQGTDCSRGFITWAQGGHPQDYSSLQARKAAAVQKVGGPSGGGK